MKPIIKNLLHKPIICLMLTIICLSSFTGYTLAHCLHDCSSEADALTSAQVDYTLAWRAVSAAITAEVIASYNLWQAARDSAEANLQLVVHLATFNPADPLWWADWNNILANWNACNIAHKAAVAAHNQAEQNLANAQQSLNNAWAALLAAQSALSSCQNNTSSHPCCS